MAPEASRYAMSAFFHNNSSKTMTSGCRGSRAWARRKSPLPAGMLPKYHLNLARKTQVSGENLCRIKTWSMSRKANLNFCKCILHNARCMKYCQHRPSKAMALLKMELATSYSPSDNFWLPLYVKFKNQNSGKAGANLVGIVVNRRE